MRADCGGFPVYALTILSAIGSMAKSENFLIFGARMGENWRREWESFHPVPASRAETTLSKQAQRVQRVSRLPASADVYGRAVAFCLICTSCVTQMRHSHSRTATSTARRYRTGEASSNVPAPPMLPTLPSARPYGGAAGRPQPVVPGSHGARDRRDQRLHVA